MARRLIDLFKKGVFGSGEPYPLNIFQGQGVDVGISRTGANYYLHHAFANYDYVTWQFLEATFSGETLHCIGGMNTSMIIDYIPHTSGVKVGTWDASGYTQTAGSKITFTTPDGTAGVFYLRTTSNQGIIKVAIDGSYTAATGLHTAQELVDLGYADATVLIANGGTLAPTDRCLDIKTVDVNYPRMDGGLTPGVHIVEMTYTGYKNPTSTGLIFYGYNFGYIGTAVKCASANAILTITSLMSSISVFEYAIYYIPTGATNPQWAGNGHSNDSQTDLKIYIDGVETTVADGAITGGAEISVVRSTNLLHSETGATVIATVVTTYTLSRVTGLTVQAVITFAVGGTTTAIRAPMLPLLQAVFDKAATQVSAGNYLLTADDDSTVEDNSRRVWIWDADGTLGAILSIPSNYGVQRAQIEDRAGAPLLNKIYFDKYNSATPLSFSIGEVWTITGNYRVQRFASADASLAK